MKKIHTIGLTLLLGAAFLSGCGQMGGATTATTSGTAGVSQITTEISADAGNTDENFVWEGTVITGLTEKGQAAEEIVIPDTCTAIGKDAFFQADMKSVVIGSSVEEIGDSAFWECNDFESISFPASVKKIAYKAFYKCGSLKTISFSEGLLEIGDEAFSFTSAEMITLPESLIMIGMNAFGPNSAMTSVYIPESMENIPVGVFGFCFNFGTKIYVKEGSWADLNFKEFIPADPYGQADAYYEKTYY